MINIEILSGDLGRVNAFYKKCVYSAEAAPEDCIIVAGEDGVIVGVVRLCKEEGALVLRGMEVERGRLREGIGSRLLRKADEAIGTEECWGIPYGHLENFYARIGFRFLEDENEAPPHLVRRIAGYRRKNPNTTYRIMRRLRT